TKEKRPLQTSSSPLSFRTPAAHTQPAKDQASTPAWPRNLPSSILNLLGFFLGFRSIAAIADALRTAFASTLLAIPPISFSVIVDIIVQHIFLHPPSGFLSYTPAQNGSAGRRNRVIVEKGLALLAHSHLPTKFWEQAFHTSVYLINYTITPILDHKSPFDKLYEKSPDYGFLKSFGYLCFPFLHPYTSNKLEFRSQPCIFIGYNSKHKGYIFFLVPTLRVYISRHVIFDEATASPISSSPVVESAPSLSDLSLSSSELSPLRPAVHVSTAPIDSIESVPVSSSSSSKALAEQGSASTTPFPSDSTPA
ncbi:hypothetical protein V2J09_022489, partial [Rumex salicifolius]